MSPHQAKKQASFPQTQWTLVLDAQEADPAALAELCRTYWYPLYAYARRSGLNVEDAEDLTQSFFERLLTKEGLQQIRRERGKLRSFLLTALKRFLTDEWRRGQCLKRGGDRPIVSIDAMSGEQRLALESPGGVPPDTEFARSWARELMERALRRVEGIYRDAGKGQIFETLSHQLEIEKPSSSYEEMAVVLGVSNAAVRFKAFKLRQRYGEALKEVVRETVTSEMETEEELAYLMSVFESPSA